MSKTGSGAVSFLPSWGRRLFERSDLPEEESRRRQYLALCLVLTIPALLAFTVIDVLEGRWSEVIPGGLVAVLLSLLLAFLARLRRVRPLLRAILGVALGIVFYETAVGGSDGLAFLWLYTVPLVVFFLFGRREGTAWCLGLLAVLSTLFFVLELHTYDPILQSRALLSLGLLCATGGFLEASRQRFHEALVRETSAVEEAIAQVQRLRGMLRICSSCKRIRDDDGYWSEIEAYLEQHSEAELSHALCPDCLEQLGRGELVEEAS